MEVCSLLSLSYIASSEVGKHEASLGKNGLIGGQSRSDDSGFTEYFNVQSGQNFAI